MRISKVDLSQPLRVRVGEVTILIFKVGDKVGRLGIEAPGEMRIDIENTEAYRPTRKGG